MAGCILAAALMVMAFPLRWASVQPQQAQQLQAELAAAEEGVVQDGGSDDEKLAGALSSRTSRLWAAAMCMTHGDAMLLCPEAIRQAEGRWWAGGQGDRAGAAAAVPPLVRCQAVQVGKSSALAIPACKCCSSLPWRLAAGPECCPSWSRRRPSCAPTCVRAAWAARCGSVCWPAATAARITCSAPPLRLSERGVHQRRVQLRRPPRMLCA